MAIFTESVCLNWFNEASKSKSKKFKGSYTVNIDTSNSEQCSDIVQRSNKIIDVANRNYDSYFKEFIKYIQDTDDEAGSKSANFIKNNTNLYEVNYTYNGNNSDTLEFCLEYKYNNTDKLPVSMIIHYTNYKLAHIEFNLI